MRTDGLLERLGDFLLFGLDDLDFTEVGDRFREAAKLGDLFRFGLGDLFRGGGLALALRLRASFLCFFFCK